MNKYKRKSKKKTLAMGIGILSSAAVVSTGFAAWIITGGDSVTGEGSITADTVSSKEHLISGLSFGENDKIFFGAPDSSTITTPKYNWLTNDLKDENLSISKTFTVDHLETIEETERTDDWYKAIFDSDKTTFTESEGSTYASAAKYTYKANASDTTDKTIVGSLPSVNLGTEKNEAKSGVYISFISSTTTDENKVGSFALDIVFTWGTAFNSENPFIYYNSMEKTKDLSSEAKTLLGEVAKIKSKFKLVITTK